MWARPQREPGQGSRGDQGVQVVIGFVVGLILVAVIFAVLVGLGVEGERADEAGPTSNARTTVASGGRFRRLIEKLGEWLPPIAPP